MNIKTIVASALTLSCLAFTLPSVAADHNYSKQFQPEIVKQLKIMKYIKELQSRQDYLFDEVGNLKTYSLMNAKNLMDVRMDVKKEIESLRKGIDSVK